MYGIGATKAGTSWLYRYLASHPECRLPALKELHYFHMLNAQNFSGAADRLNAARLRLAERKAVHGADRKWHFVRRERLLNEWETVINDAGNDPMKYTRFMEHVGENRALTADISPSYALLPPAVLRLMANLTPMTRFVYLLRDPVERLWSNVKMDAGRTAHGLPAKLVARILSGEKTEPLLRSGYADTFSRLDAGIGRDKLWVGFFENLFSDESIAKLCAFLGISHFSGDYKNKVHSGAPQKIDDETRGAFQRLLAPQYAFVEDRFGDLPDAWKQNMVRV